MNRNTPQTLSVKRKRGQASVDLLVVEHQLPQPVDEEGTEQDAKRVRTEFVYRRIRVPSRAPSQAQAAQRQTLQRTFHVSRTPNASSDDIVLVEARELAHDSAQKAPGTQLKEPQVSQPLPEQPAVPRKRPGARSVLRPATAEHSRSATPEPSRDVVRAFEQFASEVEEQEAAVKSPSKFKPKAPKLRYKDRHPDEDAAVEGEAMDLDTEYVYDTYVREVRTPGLEGLLPPESVGIIVITEEDEEFWFGEDESDREFDTDEDDENAEGYYANDYPEDEVSSDDEFDRDPYRYHRGEEEDEYDIDDGASDGFGDDNDGQRKKPLKVSAGYWGRAGE